MKLKGIIGKNIMYMFRVFPIEDKIVFSSFLGNRYGGYPKEIYKKLISSSDNIKIVWLINDNEVKIDGAKCVPYISLRALFHLVTAKVWIDDVRKREWVVKRKRQFYIQTWHGWGPCLKKVELDAQKYLKSSYIEALINDSKMADLFISECTWRTLNYRNAFAFKGDILRCLPKIDVLNEEKTTIVKKVRKELKISDETKILLYAPTFRSNSNESISIPNMDKVLDEFEQRTSESWCVIVRFHPSCEYESENIIYNSKIINATKYDSFEELLVTADAFISDYSGTIFQAINLEKEAYIYAYDYEDYIKNNRDLYFSLSDLCIPIVNSTDELIERINKFNLGVYKKNLQRLKAEIGYYSMDMDGVSYNGIDNIVKIVIDIIKKGE